MICFLTALKTRGTPISQAERNREKKENLAVIQLALIVLSYLLGYIPGAGEENEIRN